MASGVRCSEWKGNSKGWLTISSVEFMEEAATEIGKYAVC